MLVTNVFLFVAANMLTHAITYGLFIQIASKGALISHARALTREWGRKGVRANVVSPGLIPDTAMSEGTDIDEYRARASLKSAPTVEDVANAVNFLSSDQSLAIAGQELRVDCGLFGF